MSGIARHRGQPVYVLLIILAAWLVLRIIFWQQPFTLPVSIPGIAQIDSEKGSLTAPGAKPDVTQNARASQNEPGGAGFSPTGTWLVRPIPAAISPVEAPAHLPGSVAGFAEVPVEPTVAAGHQILFAAGLAHLPLIDEIRQALAPKKMSAPGLPGQARGKRWTLDAWLLARQGGVGAGPLAFRPASYGASQSGAVLRYRLSESSRHQPFAYARLSKALAAGGETDAAVGIGGRPIPALPLTAHAELRATETGGNVRVRPSAFVVTQIPPSALPGGLRAEAYGQAGYVGGNFATAFADGQLKIDREVARFDLASLRAGAGAWGGAQKGAERLDVGPTASVQLRLGKTPARVAVDYRFRVAGDAAPGSGIAVTLTTGF